MNIYLAGPMTGIEHYNFPAFHTAADALRGLGHTVFSPAEHDAASGFDAVAVNSDGQDAESHGFSLRKALKADLSWICDNADAIALLPNYDNSKGVAAELALADALKLPVGYWHDFDENGPVKYVASGHIRKGDRVQIKTNVIESGCFDEDYYKDPAGLIAEVISVERFEGSQFPLELRILREDDDSYDVRYPDLYKYEEVELVK